MLDWRSFSLLDAMMRFGHRNEERMELLAWETGNEPEPRRPEEDICDLRVRQEALLAGIEQTLQKTEIGPYRRLISQLATISQRPAA